MSTFAPGRLRIKAAGGALAAIALVGGSVAAGSEERGSVEPRAGIGEVRVMSFNIRYGTADDGDDAWPNRRALVLDVIRAFDPEVLGIQEALAFQIDQLAGALPGHEVIGVGRDDGARAGEFSAILVARARFEIVASGTFWFSDTPEAPGSMSWGNRIPRISTWARLRDRDTGRRFSVYNVHWDHESQPSRERSAALLLERIAARADSAEPVLVTGDFNAGEANPAFRMLVESDAIALRDTYRDLHPNATDTGTFNGFEGLRGGDKIDAVLASEGWCTRGAEIVRTAEDGRYPSDHFPVAAVVEEGEPATCERGEHGRRRRERGDGGPKRGSAPGQTSASFSVYTRPNRSVASTRTSAIPGVNGA